MKAIWKFEVQITGRTSIEMPKGAEIIAFQTQYDKPCIWAIVDTGIDSEARFFRVIGTGHNYDEIPGKYIGTIQMFGGGVVWHLFEVT